MTEIALYGWHKNENPKGTVLQNFGDIDQNLDHAKTVLKQRKAHAKNKANPSYGWKYRLIQRKVKKWKWFPSSERG